MNDLVYVMYTLKLKNKETRRKEVLTFHEIDSDDKWVTEEEDVGEANVEKEQPFDNVDN
ncbi:hypothetical protein A2U01_0051582 [Trifolium medium]|uniref:Uncharacterized protein n=1 Tax=Trifolium medium TaxID=97028 RepID=A0A392R1A3_9FABA|nr:hypothetical protein [Trifolium medium]